MNPKSHLNSIIQGDCMEIMTKFDDSSIDLIITSPPYNISARLKRLNEYNKYNSDLKNGYGSYDDNMDPKEYLKWQRQVIAECLRILKPDGALLYNHKEFITNGLLESHHELLKDFPVRQNIIWDKGSGYNFNKSFLTPSYENVYLICNKNFKFRKGTVMRDVLTINRVKDDEHPAPFPVSLPLLLINATNAKIILDPFSGTGTTACAAKRLGRQYIGIEQNMDYVKSSRVRVSKVKLDAQQKKLI